MMSLRGGSALCVGGGSSSSSSTMVEAQLTVDAILAAGLEVSGVGRGESAPCTVRSTGSMLTRGFLLVLCTVFTKSTSDD
ncbi:hypothetical protein PR003_g17583 [Phytophthora rubi]|uniref:Uncharacterized protein n=1 Tax=Phytophthora rubi TaxID=129364 RepID=A0A6A4EF35_9STRA|nr:hypothetical protein PR001_g16919 [Phytophthora rubi]KAE9034690.1 hypothetical protein PR002_g7985 [Phytophthora rubi]KAE9320947.1 hypothetical protein PR003_g17583 [Phytophthora rubi]